MCLIIYSYEAAGLMMCPGHEEAPAVSQQNETEAH